MGTWVYMLILTAVLVVCDSSGEPAELSEQCLDIGNVKCWLPNSAESVGCFAFRLFSLKMIVM